MSIVRNIKELNVAMRECPVKEILRKNIAEIKTRKRVIKQTLSDFTNILTPTI